MSVQSLKIKDLFNYLSTHFHDEFNRMNATSFSTFIGHLDLSALIQINQNKALNLSSLSLFIEFIFEKFNFLECGENAIAFVEFVQKNKVKLTSPKLNWISTNLTEFCCNSTTAITSSPLVLTSPLQNINNTVIPSSSTQPRRTSNEQISEEATSVTTDSINNISSLLNSMRNDINSEVINQIKFYMLNSMSKSIKDEHYQELEQLLDRKTQYNNSLTVNKQYNTNNVIQPSINKARFPTPWMPDDPEFVDQFNKLITSFQVQIQQLNISFIENKLNKTIIEINKKIEFINNVDTNATDKCKALETMLINKHKSSLIKSTEKVNRLISTANTTSTSTNPLSTSISNPTLTSINNPPATNSYNNNRRSNIRYSGRGYNRSYYTAQNKIHNNNNFNNNISSLPAYQQNFTQRDSNYPNSTTINQQAHNRFHNPNLVKNDNRNINRAQQNNVQVNTSLYNQHGQTFNQI